MARLAHRFSLAALAAITLTACGAAPAAQRGDDGAHTAHTAAAAPVASPRVAPADAGLVIELDDLPDGAARGDWLALRRAARDPAELPAPTLQWLQVVDVEARRVAPLEPLSADRRTALRQGELEVVAAEGADVASDKRIARVAKTGATTLIDRGRSELVDTGEVYVLGDPFVSDADWSVFEVGTGQLEEQRAGVALRVGDRLPREGQTLVRVGTTFATVAPRVHLRVDPGIDPGIDPDEVGRRLRTELERTSLGGLEPTLEPWDGQATCRTGQALANAWRTHDADPTSARDALDDDAVPTPSVDILLAPGAAPGLVRLGWWVGPADIVATQTPDLVGGCLETTLDGALVVARLASLSAARRWSELHQHGAHLLRAEPGAVGEELGWTVSLFEASALFELGHIEASLAILEELAGAPDARDPAFTAPAAAALSLHRAERAFELGQVDAAARHLDAVDVAALDDALEPTRAVLAASVALGRSPGEARAVLDGSRAVDHPVLVAWRGLLDAIESGRGGDMLAVMHEIDGEGGEALSVWPGSTAALLEIAARVSMSEGLSEPAAALLHEARLRYRAAGLSFRAGSALLQLAEVQSASGKLLESTETAMVAASDLAEAGAFVEAAGVLLGVGARLNRALLEGGGGLDVPRALELMGEALRVARVLATRANDATTVADTWSQMGEALLRHFDDPAAAIEAYESAAFYAARAGRPARAARAELGLALAVERSGGSGEEIAPHVDAARRHAEQAGDEALLRDIERLLDDAAAP